MQEVHTMGWLCLLVVATFIIIFGLIAFEKVPRTYIAIFGAVLMIVFGVFDIQEAVAFVNWETIGFLWGTFLLIEVLVEAGFFNWTALVLARQLDYQPVKIFIFFPILGFFLSGLINSLTVMIFLSVITFQLGKLLRFDPVPVIVTEVILANIGGAATLVGDPPNVILGTVLGFGFNEFVVHNGPVAFLSAAGALVTSYLLNRKDFIKSHQPFDLRLIQESLSRMMIKDVYLLRWGLFGLIFMLILLMGRPFLVQLNLPVSIAAASLLPAFLVLTLGGPKIFRHHFMRRIDSETLIFFLGLFILIGALEKQFIIQAMADWLANFFPTPFLFIGSLFWGSAIFSAFVDNVPLAMAMASLIKSGLGEGMSISAGLLVWTISLATDLGGNLTPIGSSANVVAYAYLQKNRQKINWGRWFILALIPSLVALMISYGAILIKMAVGFY